MKFTNATNTKNQSSKSLCTYYILLKYYTKFKSENFYSSFFIYFNYYLKVYFFPPIVLPKR